MKSYELNRPTAQTPKTAHGPRENLDVPVCQMCQVAQRHSGTGKGGEVKKIHETAMD